jgi:UDP-N-acetylmuramoyl-L-alanyl-D-glutamate--2,6-diaminopimelate ligase
MTDQTSLQHIFAELPLPFCMADIPAIPIKGVAIDSRVVRACYLFAALKGRSADGHNYISKAIENGAAAVVGEREISGLSVPYIRLDNPRRALTWIAAAFYNWPGRRLRVIGVTGTDGKTTTTNLIYQIMLAGGLKAGMISTVNAVIGNEVLDTGFHVTTPDAQDVQRYLAKMVDAGLTHVVLETTSHGWAQFRVDACEFDIGVVTNITHEHMDEHGSYENYRAAKARLFESLEKTSEKPQGNPRLGVINRDDLKSFDFLNRFIRVKKLNYGLGEERIRALDIRYSHRDHFGEKRDFEIPVSSKLVGAYMSRCRPALAATVYGLG